MVPYEEVSAAVLTSIHGLCYLLICLWFLAIEQKIEQGTDWYSRVPHHCFQVLGPSHGVSCWVFLRSLASASWPQGFPSMPAVMLWGQGKPLGIWELDAKSRKSWDKKTSRISCSESSPSKEPPHSPWSQSLWQRELRDSEMMKPKMCQGEVFQGHSCALVVHLTVARCHQHTWGAIGLLQHDWSRAPVGFGLRLDLEVSELRLGEPIFLLANEVWKAMIPLFTHLTYKWGEKKRN